MADYVETIFEKTGFPPRTAYSWSEHYQLIFEGYTPGAPLPGPSRDKTHAYLDDLDELEAELLDELDEAADEAVTEQLGAYVPLTQKGEESGVAPLDTNSRVPEENLPVHLTEANIEEIRTLATAEGDAFLDTPEFRAAVNTEIADDLAGFIAVGQKGANSGVAPLDSLGRLPSTRVPDYLKSAAIGGIKSTADTTHDTVEFGRLNDAILTGRFARKSIYVSAAQMMATTGSPTLQATTSHVPAWRLDKDTDESVAFSVELPEAWEEFEIWVEGHNGGAGTGSVKVRILYGAYAPGDVVATNTSGEVTTFVAGAQNVRQSIKTKTGMAAISTKRHVFRILRDADDGADNLGNDWNLTGALLVPTKLTNFEPVIPDEDLPLDGYAFLPAHNALIPAGMTVLHNANPPDDDTDDTFKYYPGTDYASAQASFAGSSWTGGSKWYFLWANRADGTGGNTRANPLPAPAVYLDSEGNVVDKDAYTRGAARWCRATFTTMAKADAATRAQVRHLLGMTTAEIRADWLAAGGVAGDLISEADFRANPSDYCTVESDDGGDRLISMVDTVILPTATLEDGPHPELSEGILLDYEVSDERTEAHALAYFDYLTDDIHAAGKKLWLYSNPIDVPSRIDSGISAATVPTILDYVDRFGIHLWAGNDHGSIEASYNAQIAMFGSITTSEWINKIAIIFELGSDTTGTTLEDALWVHQKLTEVGDNHPHHLMFWRHGAELGGSQQRLVNKKILTAITGSASTVIPGTLPEDDPANETEAGLTESEVQALIDEAIDGLGGGGGSDDQTAAEVPFTPGAGVAAVTTQLAIEEVAGDVTAHLSDAAGAHAASAISFTPVSTLSATDVQAAIEELLAEAGSGGSDDQTAAEVVFTPTGAVAATDVQAAIAELDTEKAPLASPALTGNPTAPTQTAGNNSTRLATTAYVDTADALKAPLASPAFTGNPTAPTPATSDNDTSIATTAFVQAVVAALIAAAPGALDTLDELAAAMGDDANFATTVTNALALKAPLASPALTGNPTAPTPTAGDNDTSIATTAFVHTEVDAHVSDAVAAHAATAISYAGSTNLSATTVEAALDELDSEKAATTYVDAADALKRPLLESTVQITAAGAYTLLLTDLYQHLQANSASDISITLPTNATLAIPTGGWFRVTRLGAGNVTIDGAAVTMQSNASTVTVTSVSIPRYSSALVRKRSTDTWNVILESNIGSAVQFTPAGDLAATNVQSAIEELDTEKAPKASPTLSGTPVIPNAVLDEKSAAASGTSGTVTLDLSTARIFTLSPTGNVTTLTISNVPASGRAVTVTLIVTQGGTPRTIATPTGGVFLGAATPTQVASKVCAFTYVTVDGGTTWLCSAAVQV